jgi:RNA polymerase primary sigma factor
MPSSETGVDHDAIRWPRRLYKEYIKQRNLLVDNNYKLVISIAHRYSRRWNVPLEDLVQEGTVGMIRAATKFQPSVGVKFSTYGTWWIHQYIARHLQDKEKFIRAPQYVQRISQKLKTIEEHLAKDKGREPTTEEVAEFAEIPMDVFTKLHPLTKYPISLENTIIKSEDMGNNGATLKDMLRSDTDVEEEVEINLQHAKLKTALARLPDRERNILERRYGLDNRLVESLEEVAEIYGLSRERIRQIQGTSILKVRSFLKEAIND